MDQHNKRSYESESSKPGHVPGFFVLLGVCLLCLRVAYDGVDEEQELLPDRGG